MSLEEKLAAIRADSAEKFPEDVKEKFARATEWLRSTGIAERALKVGDAAPEFTLPNTEGRQISSKELLSSGPLAITFYRGVW